MTFAGAILLGSDDERQDDSTKLVAPDNNLTGTPSRRANDATLTFFEVLGSIYGNYMAGNPRCAPWRASLMTNRWSHNHLVVTNEATNASGLGGGTQLVYWPKVVFGHLREHGKFAGIAGKLMNNFSPTSTEIVPSAFLDEWYILQGGTRSNVTANPASPAPSHFGVNDYDEVKNRLIALNTPAGIETWDDGNRALYSQHQWDGSGAGSGPVLYPTAYSTIFGGPFGSELFPREIFQTWIILDRTIKLIRSAVAQYNATGKQFFLLVTPTSPHQSQDADPGNPFSDRWATLNVQDMPHNPNFSEGTTDTVDFITDKPFWVSQEPAPSYNSLNTLFKQRIKAVRGLDYLFQKAILEEIQNVNGTGQNLLDSVVLARCTDNGYELGGHDLGAGKGTCFPDSQRLILAVKGGASVGRFRDGDTVASPNLRPVGAPDITATIYDLMGLPTLALSGDGQPLDFVAAGEREIPLEPYRVGTDGPPGTFSDTYGVYNGKHWYTKTRHQYNDGAGHVGPAAPEISFYIDDPVDPNFDPWQLHSKHADPAYTSIRANLDAIAERLKTAVGWRTFLPPAANAPTVTLPLFGDDTGGTGVRAFSWVDSNVATTAPVAKDLLLVIQGHSSATKPVKPAGFIELDSYVSSSMSVTLSYKIAIAGEGTTVTSGASQSGSGNFMTGWCYRPSSNVQFDPATFDAAHGYFVAKIPTVAGTTMTPTQFGPIVAKPAGYTPKVTAYACAGGVYLGGGTGGSERSRFNDNGFQRNPGADPGLFSSASGRGIRDAWIENNPPESIEWNAWWTTPRTGAGIAAFVPLIFRINLNAAAPTSASSGIAGFAKRITAGIAATKASLAGGTFAKALATTAPATKASSVAPAIKKRVTAGAPAGKEFVGPAVIANSHGQNIFAGVPTSASSSVAPKITKKTTAGAPTVADSATSTFAKNLDSGEPIEKASVDDGTIIGPGPKDWSWRAGPARLGWRNRRGNRRP